MSPGHRLLLKWARMVHVYLTMFGLVLVLFFAVTGFMLNHENWFGLDQSTVTTGAGTVPLGIVEPLDKLAVVELLRRDFGVRGSLNAFDDRDEDELRVVFKGPAREDVANIKRKTGRMEITYESRGVLNLLTDLHKGKDTGEAWNLVIDSVCIMLLLISATGLILWQSLRGRAKYGLVYTLLGVAFSAGVFYLYVDW